MVFKRSVQRYGRTPEPETPFQRAGQLWDERIGSARVQARNWRLMAFGSLGLASALAGGMVWQSQQSRVTPYVVEVDRLGEARAVTPAEADYQPTDPQIAWHLGHFIEQVRSISLDPVLMRQDWLSAYDFTTRRGAQFLGDYARSADPFAQIGQKSVAIQVTSVVRASDRSFQVKWTETAYDHGSLAGHVALDRHPHRDREDACQRRHPPAKSARALCRCDRLEPGTGTALRHAPPAPPSMPANTPTIAPVPAEPAPAAPIDQPSAGPSAQETQP